MITAVRALICHVTDSMSVFLSEAEHVCHFLWLLFLLFGEYRLESMLTPVIFHETVCCNPMNCYYEIEICSSDSTESGSF